MTERDAQVGTNGGLSQRWRDKEHQTQAHEQVRITRKLCADELDAAKLRIEEAVKALPELFMYGAGSGWVSCEAVLKIIREIL